MKGFCAFGLSVVLIGCSAAPAGGGGDPAPGSDRAGATGTGGSKATGGAPGSGGTPGGGATGSGGGPIDEPGAPDAASGTGGATPATGSGGNPGSDGGAAPTGDDAAAAPPPAAGPPCPADRKLVFRLNLADPDWNGGAAGVEAIMKKLGTASMAGAGNASVVPDGEHVHALKVLYPKGSGSTACVEEKACPVAGGMAFRVPLPQGNTITSAVLSYWVKFDPAFEWVKGGKLPGLCGGECATGGRDVEPDRFSIRYMWRGGNAAEIYAYLTNPPNPGYGLDMGLGSWHWQNDGKWHQIQEELILNTANNNDGIIRVWYDTPTTGKPNFEQKNLKYYDRVKFPNLGIDKLIFSTFHGGHDASWAPKKDVVAYFADVQVCQ
jgi:hypothetical protein